MAQAPTQPLILIVGPTAAGKTALALALAQRLNGEIVSADSRQVYRGLDIGSAKATASERAKVPHHLLDVVDLDEKYDAARFVDEARARIAEIAGRGKIPLVVGGTGLYLRALCGGIAPAPGRDAQLRVDLQSFAKTHGAQALHQRLADVDPNAAARLPVGDQLRIIRALEVFTLSGQSLSAHQAQHAFADRPYQDCWLVVDQPKAVLEQRIHSRAKTMFAQGLVDEACALRDRFGDHPLLQTMGYAEALAFADGQLDQPQAIEQTRLRTRRYAKRQRTWFRREPVFYWGLAAKTEDYLNALKTFGVATG